jgi:hypothetical protein
MRWVGKEIIIEIQSQIVAIKGYLQFERAILMEKTYFRYWRRGVISANTIGFGEGEILQKIHNVLPICQDITNYLSCSKRKRK